MNKHLFHIGNIGLQALFVVLMILWANVSFGQADMGNALPEHVRLEQSFQLPQLSSIQLQAYQDRAKQKVGDFFDLEKVLQKENMEQELKQFMVEQGVELFVSDSVPCLGHSRVSAFLQSKDLAFPPSEVLKIEILQGFVPGFSETQSLMRVSFQERDFPSILLTTHLIQRTKSFGKEELTLWEVLLGEMKWE